MHAYIEHRLPIEPLFQHLTYLPSMSDTYTTTPIDLENNSEPDCELDCELENEQNNGLDICGACRAVWTGLNEYILGVGGIMECHCVS